MRTGERENEPGRMRKGQWRDEGRENAFVRAPLVPHRREQREWGGEREGKITFPLSVKLCHAGLVVEFLFIFFFWGGKILIPSLLNGVKTLIYPLFKMGFHIYHYVLNLQGSLYMDSFEKAFQIILIILI